MYYYIQCLVWTSKRKQGISGSSWDEKNVLLQNLFNAVQFVLIDTYFSTDDDDVAKHVVQNETVVTQNIGRC